MNKKLIEKSLKKACEDALTMMEAGLQNNSGYGNKIEKPFQEFLNTSLRKKHKDIKVEREIPLDLIGARQHWPGRESGEIDFVLNDTFGIEIKVVRLPRISQKFTEVLYDISQLGSDWMRISGARILSSGILMLLVHGPLVNALEKTEHLRREVHNRFFADYQSSLQFGELKRDRDEPWRKPQVKGMKSMAIHRPYSASGAEKIPIKSGFVILSPKNHFAVLTIPVK